MNYLVLARRTRPQNLNELVGQNAVRDALKEILTSHKIPHAVLFTGVRGTGKTSCARILAKSLTCEKGPTPNPCQVCRHCVQITACAHEDVIEIDGASNTGIDNIRALRESTHFYPVSSRYKIFIIDEVHMLSGGAFNALLKTLEEPPSHVVFILATTELHKIPATIRSRCLIFSFKKIAHEVIVEHLKKILQKEHVLFEEDAVSLIAREARGSLRDSLSLLEQALALRSDKALTCSDTKKGLGLQNEDTAFDIFSFICNKDSNEALRILQKSEDAGLDLSMLIELVANYFRLALILKSAPNQNKGLLLEEERSAIQQITKNINRVALGEIFKILLLSIKEMQRSAHPLSWAEIAILDAINRADWISASDMLLQMKNVPTLTNTKIDLDLYKQFVTVAKKRSQTLAARLNLVQLEAFNKNTVIFADTTENAAYLSFDPKDQEYFLESLKEIGLDETALKGPKTSETSISLKEIQNAEQQKDLAFKKKEIFSRDSVKNLMMFTKEIKLTPIKN